MPSIRDAFRRQSWNPGAKDINRTSKRSSKVFRPPTTRPGASSNFSGVYSRSHDRFDGMGVALVPGLADVAKLGRAERIRHVHEVQRHRTRWDEISGLVMSKACSSLFSVLRAQFVFTFARSEERRVGI